MYQSRALVVVTLCIHLIDLSEFTKEFAQKVVKTWNFNSKPREKTLKFANSMFQTSLFKMSFTKIILLYFFVISTLSTQTLIRSQIDLGFHCFYLENTWNFASQEMWEPCICFNTFRDFYDYNLCENTWNLAQKNLEKLWKFRTKNLEKIWNLVFGKKWEPWHHVYQVDTELQLWLTVVDLNEIILALKEYFIYSLNMLKVGVNFLLFHVFSLVMNRWRR